MKYENPTYYGQELSQIFLICTYLKNSNQILCALAIFSDINEHIWMI